jgi:hypothetical protein
MKLSYKENLAHVRQIWDVYKRPFLDPNAFLRHIKEYKVFNENLSSHANVLLWNAFIDPMNTCTPFVKSWRNVLANAECQINKEMQKHPSINKCGVLALVKWFVQMGKVQHF